MKLKTKFKLAKRKMLNNVKKKFACVGFAKAMLLKYKHLTNRGFAIKEFITSANYRLHIDFENISNIYGCVYQFNTSSRWNTTTGKTKVIDKNLQHIELECYAELNDIACEKNNIPKEYASIDTIFSLPTQFKHNKNGFYCNLCKDRTYYASKEELFYEHTLKDFIEWCNEKLQHNHKLLVHYSDNSWSEARIIAENADYDKKLYAIKLDIVDN